MRYPPPGRLVDVGTHRLHLRCAGEGAPAVIFDAALGASSLSWSLVQPSVARVTRSCSYDRGGFGWSDAGPLPRTADRLAGELHELLHRGGVPGPYVLVAHSFGGLVARIFAARHPGDTAGLVLIEPAIPEEWVEPSAEQRLLIARGAQLCRYGAAASRSGLARMVAGLVSLGALAPARGLVRIISRGGLHREDEGILAPIWKLPPDARAVLKQMWTHRAFFEALGSQIATVSESAAAVLQRTRPDFGSLPLVVMSSATADDRRRHADVALARRSMRGRHVIADNSGHWVPLDAPHAVTDVIVEMVRDIRESGPVASATRASRL
jgi:pimeloyl-ACP methyl ester carboxylesterase